MKKIVKKTIVKKPATKMQSGGVKSPIKKPVCKGPRGNQYSDMTFLYTWNTKTCSYDSKRM